MQISKNFTLEELLDSPTALRWGFKEQFTPPEDVVENLINLVVHILQPLRDKIGPIKVTSGYRCPRVNSKVGGSTKTINGKVVQTSQHCYGLAADIVFIQDGIKANNVIIEGLKELSKNQEFTFDQCIKEYGSDHNPSWIHISFKESNNRKQVLRKKEGSGYIPTTL